MKWNTIVLLIPLSLLGGFLLNVVMVGAVSNSAAPIRLEAVEKTGGADGRSHRAGSWQSEDRPKESVAERAGSREGVESAMTKVATSGIAPEFLSIPRHGHEHHEFEVPDEFTGLTMDEWVDLLPPRQGERLQRYRDDLASLNPDLRRFVCWAPGTAPEVVAGFRRAEFEGGMVPGDFQVQANQFLSPQRWTSTATNPFGSSSRGQPITVRWSIAPDGTQVPGDEGVRGPSDFRTWMQGIYGGSTSEDATTQGWFSLMEEAFNHLGDQCGLTFVYEPTDTGSSFSSSTDGAIGIRGDIRIGARDIDGNSGTLAFAYSPGYGEIVMDSTDIYFDNTSSDSRRFVNVLTHEIGHAIGLAHVCPVTRTKLMEPFATGLFRGAQFDEFQSTQRQYGDPLEVHDGNTNNDAASRATELDVGLNTTYSKEWLSLDGINDSDWFRFVSPANARLTVRVVPASASYLEGPQTSSCGDGGQFSAANQQDLSLEIWSSSGSVLVASQDANPIGGFEFLDSVLLQQAGEYMIKVVGKAENAAQLYRLEVLIESTPTGVDLDVVETRLVEESNVGKNGNVDPDETVVIGVTVSNFGMEDAELVTGFLTGPAGFIDYGGQQSIAAIPSGLQAEMLFTVSLDGDCGDSVTVNLLLQSNAGSSVHPIDLELGSIGGEEEEGFDGSSALPSGWTTSESGRGSLWSVVGTRRSSAPNSAFVSGPSRVGLSILSSPVMGIGSGGGTLSFRHWYDLQANFDGGQLQASLDGGSWFDLLDSNAVVMGGGYNRTIVDYGESDIADEEAWSGNSGGFITTSIEIPSDWAGSQIQFRWRLASDNSGTSTGWWVDNVVFNTDLISCDPYLPMVALSLDPGNLSERPSVDPLDLTLSTPLPLKFPISVPLTLSGTADQSDLSGSPSAELASGETESVFKLAAKLDRLDEGSESLTITRPSSSTGYVSDGPTSFTVSVEDSEYSEWSADEFAPGSLLTGPDEDADGDGWTNVAEYLSGTDPNDRNSVPQPEMVLSESTLGIELGSSVVERGDAEIRGETSTDLMNWSDENVGRSSNGFEVSREDPSRFLRLIYEFLDVPEEP